MSSSWPSTIDPAPCGQKPLLVLVNVAASLEDLLAAAVRESPLSVALCVRCLQGRPEAAQLLRLPSAGSLLCLCPRRGRHLRLPCLREGLPPVLKLLGEPCADLLGARGQRHEALRVFVEPLAPLRRGPEPLFREVEGLRALGLHAPGALCIRPAPLQ